MSRRVDLTVKVVEGKKDAFNENPSGSTVCHVTVTVMCKKVTLVVNQILDKGPFSFIPSLSCFRTAFSNLLSFVSQFKPTYENIIAIMQRVSVDQNQMTRAEQRKQRLLEAETELAREEAEALKMTEVRYYYDTPIVLDT